MSDRFSGEQILSFFKQDVDHSIRDAQRIVERDPNPYENARAVWEAKYSKVLHESVLDEYKNGDANAAIS